MINFLVIMMDLWSDYSNDLSVIPILLILIFQILGEITRNIEKIFKLDKYNIFFGIIKGN